MSTATTTDFVWPYLTGEDMRKPLYTFEYGDEAYGFYSLCNISSMLFIFFVLSEALVAAMTAVVIYYTIVEPRKGRKGGPPLLTTGVLAAFGVFLPLWIFGPPYVINQLGIQNKAFRFTLAAITPTLSIFRILEALFGFTPPHATKSVQHFVLVFSSPIILVFDNVKSNTFVRADRRQVLRHLLRLIGWQFLSGIYMSCFFFLPWFPSLVADPSSGPDDYYSWRRVWDVATLSDTVLRAVFLQLTLSTMGESLSLITVLLTGIQVQGIMSNPLFESSSPSDFWCRWNVLIHQVLKQGAYKPVRSLTKSKIMAVVASFIASGLFHEALLRVTFFDHANLIHGPTTAFFLWQAMLVAGEHLLGHWSMISPITVRAVPGWLRTAMIVMLGAPLGHWYLEPFISSEFYWQQSVFLPCVLPIKR